LQSNKISITIKVLANTTSNLRSLLLYKNWFAFNNIKMLKNLTQWVCQKILGFNRYLYIFSLIQITRMQAGLSEKAFRHFVSMLTDEGAILDIGANIGIMSVTLAKKYPNSIVHAFEPMPQNILALQRIVEHYQLHNIQIHPIAVGDKNEEVKMIMPLLYHAKMQGLSHVIEKSNEKERGVVFSVNMQRIDDISALQMLPKITGVKIDVENFEYYVLKGSIELLTKHKPLVYCELWNNERRILCIELMHNLGYGVKIFDGSGLVDFIGQEAINFFFSPLDALEIR
jgi:FkbM family methyltransferase